MYSGLLLSPGSRRMGRSVRASRREDGREAELLATIDGVPYQSLAPSVEDMMFFDILYSSRDLPVGLELRIIEDRIRELFIGEAADWDFVTRNGAWPRVWLGAERWGEPKADTVELFGDAWLCRADEGQWAFVMDLQGTFLQNMDIGVLRP